MIPLITYYPVGGIEATSKVTPIPTLQVNKMASWGNLSGLPVAEPLQYKRFKYISSQVSLIIHDPTNYLLPGGRDRSNQ